MLRHVTPVVYMSAFYVAAFIFEATGSLDYSFMIIGAIQVGGSMLVFILLALRASGCAEVI